MSTFRIVVRRSIGLTTLVAMLGIVALHVLARERPWTHEWFWAIYQFNFVTVMLGPVVAGLGAWEGARFSKGRGLFNASNRELLGLIGIWSALLTWTLMAYAVGLAVVAILVKLAGTPGLPDIRAVEAIGPALALLAVEAATGLAVGWILKSPLAAPACAVGSFLVILFLYIKGPGQLIIVGGATDSLLALTPRRSLQAAQILCYLTVSVAALVFAARWFGWGRRRNPIPTLALGTFAVASVVLVIGQGRTILEPHVPTLRCFGVQPEVCAGPGYASRLPDARAALLPYLRVLQEAGVTVPRRFAQGQEPGSGEVGPVTVALLKGNGDEAGLLTMTSYFKKSCDLQKNGRVFDMYQAVSYWMSAQVAGVPMPNDPTVPDVLREGTADAQRQWVRGALQTIQRCGA